MINAGFPRRSTGYEKGPTQKNEVRAEGKIARNVQTRAYSAIHHKGHVRSDRIANRRQGLDRRRRRIQLTAAMIGDDHPVHADGLGKRHQTGRNEPYDQDRGDRR